ncbi:MAG: XRE family transcriptional regulator [Pseudotabrizicola sp.]|uniref:helix-turn-helix domain-containing protein n=1 Tax=Pseudotabrizicola sp. TaxID=2939647 RepID=UPI002730F144|nr:XRE family transcriptional regulator [Pseudotabrizicola sp.]MDP2079686.1 XRE family transcriptional regulator [Pseudotabrizicola sp.]MDZ7574221.1 XRE family transcriptional regulator [Pseudotabrizicola sp.]
MGLTERPRHSQAHTALAARIRQWRDERSWNQQELADRAGIARSTLSKIENGLMSPTFEVLLKLARGFETELSDLVRTESVPLSGRMVVERSAADRTVFPYPHNRLWPLAATLKGRAFQSAFVEFTQTDLTDFGPWNSHPTEDLLLVLSGLLEFHSEGYETAVLNPGDTVHFDGSVPHACLSAGTVTCRCLYVYAAKVSGI